MNSNLILGLNVNHADSSACIIQDGELKFAIEEEKLNRKKHWAGVPFLSIEQAIITTNSKPHEFTDIAINSNPFSNLKKKIPFFLRNYIFGKKKFEIFQRFRNKISLKSELVSKFNFNKNIRFHFIDHHYAHIASAFYPSNFNDSLVISVDGFGDFVSTAIADCKNNKIFIKKKIFFPDSLGVFYESMTQFLGFKNFGDEYKLMGLSSYGNIKNKYDLDKLFLKKKFPFQLNQKYFLHAQNNYSYKFKGVPFQNSLYSSETEKLILKKDNNIEDIAANVQSTYEEVFFNILKESKKYSKSRNLCLAGGCALNSAANGKISSSNGFDKLYIPYAPGDAGGAIGAAMAVYYNNHSTKLKNTRSPYLGPEYSKDEIDLAINKVDKNKFDIKYDETKNKYKYVAKELSKSKIVGWFQNKIEFGQRALGNRSILADPRNENIREIINSKIKKRELFRPFAPAVLDTYKNDWFKFTLSKSYYMESVIKVKDDKKNLIPSVVHVDNTCRTQIVKEDHNKAFYDLILEFYNLTKVPILLNTSFNENEPIVCKPEEAVDCFLRTKMDILCIGNFILSRKVN